VLNNFSKNDEKWLVPLLSAIAEAAPLLAKDDDVGFMNKVALLLAPPEKNSKAAELSSKAKKGARGNAEDAE
jgi:PTH1 family peptidyl-tRNA hydrolase